MRTDAAECGLDYVWLLNGFTILETAYGPAAQVDRAEELDRRIALAVIHRQHSLTGQEVRFLRGLLDMTQTELGALLGKDAQSVARWERVKTAVPPTEDRALRQIYLEATGHALKFTETARMVASIVGRSERFEFRELPEGVWESQAA